MTYEQEHLRNGTALVVGGSMAGLLAARVLSDYYTEVYLLERDQCPVEPLPRKGVPQAQHAHALLPRGQQILEELFPGLTRDLLEKGALRGFGRFFAGGGFVYPVRNGPGSLFTSRPLLETEVRARLRSLPNVHLLEGCTVLGLVVRGNEWKNSRIGGVRMVNRQKGESAQTMAADLVVDASGRGSRLDEWLKEFDYPTPAVELVEVGMGYATRFYRREPLHLNGDLMVNIAPTLERKRACGMMAQEGDRWIVTLAGYFGDYPPLDEAGFLAFAQSLPVVDIYDLIRTATPLSEAVAYKFPSNQRRHYQRMDRFPDGLLVIGDAICSFTPIYGQGMSVAAVEALELRNCLAAGRDGFAARYFSQVTPVIDTAWSMAAGNDQRLAPAAPTGSFGKRLLNWYLDRLKVAARNDPEVAVAFMKVGGLLAPPSSVLRPATVWRVMTNGWQKPASQDKPAMRSKMVNM